MTTQQTTEEYLSQRITWIRGQKVMFDFVLAELYDVETKVLNQAVRRNIDSAVVAEVPELPGCTRNCLAALPTVVLMNRL